GTASDSARDHALSLFSAAQTKEQRLDAVRGLLGGTGSQFDGRIGENRFNAREYANFTRSQYAPPSEANTDLSKTKPPVNQTTQTKTPPTHSMDVQRPKDLPTSVGTKDFRNSKTGKVQAYWYDAAGKPLRPVAPGELPKE